jgi:histidine ammonia-lyase
MISPEMNTRTQVITLQAGLTDNDWFALARAEASLQLPAERIQEVQANRDFLEQGLHDEDVTWYGIQTGFGALCNTRIEADRLEELQHNLVLSHACGCGPDADPEVVRLMLALKVHALAMAYSGVRPLLLDLLLTFYNHDMLPVVPTQGSLGASGDLAPLAHLVLPILGLGFCDYQGNRISGARALELLGLSPLKLAAKEGLALLNGTQFMLASGWVFLMHARRLEQWSVVSAALSCEAFLVSDQPFDELIHRVRPHAGQQATAQLLRQLLEGSVLRKSPRPAVQDPYSFRCIPQVHGTSVQVLDALASTLRIESDSVTDNPLVDHRLGKVLSGGNFHGQVLAMAFDHAALAINEWASMAERRVFWLLSGTRGLPPFLATDSGVESGLMIAQYTAAALVSQNKQLATPTVVDTVPTSNGQEDHVSMGANGVNRLKDMWRNAMTVQAIEWLTANRAMMYRQESLGPVLHHWCNEYRKQVHLPPGDAQWSLVIQDTLNFMRSMPLGHLDLYTFDTA